MKTAVILFNLGGPDGPESVRPFLFNLFSDRAIIRLPVYFRWPLAAAIAARRTPLAMEIYHQIGGGSPILANTQAQASALEAALGDGFKAFPCMRYWHPRSREVARAVMEYAPQRIVLLPLYPQFSTTTTASSLIDWHRAAEHAGLRAPDCAIFSYPEEPGFIATHADLIRPALAEAARSGPVRVLFSAHGLPEKIVRAGDPYPSQVQRSVAEIVKALDVPNLDYVLCYQSRVGRLPWIGPATDAEIARAAREKRAIVVVPVAFVSEHSETLVELDIEYAKLAGAHGAPAYIRTPTPGTHPAFIEGLAALVRKAMME